MADQAVSPLGQGTGHAVIDEVEGEAWSDRDDAAEALVSVLIDGFDEFDESLVLVVLWDRDEGACGEDPGIAPVWARRGNPQPGRHGVQRP